ncbi:MAG: DOMON domain-containing protein [Bacteroidota bacterium]
MLLLLILYGAMLTLPANCSQGKVERNGMTVKWKIKYERIHFEMEAPTDGWLAIGFNEKEGLVGTNLIMGAVKNNQVTMTDDFIVSFGNPQPIEKLGGSNQLSDQKGKEQEGRTTIVFSMPIEAADEFHIDLKKGKTIHLLIAYSTSDDFDHHSIMRTSAEITL